LEAKQKRLLRGRDGSNGGLESKRLRLATI
jgi:hypothetical protein